MKKKILTLTISKQWFDMIADGRKNEEYREIKPYWVARLFHNNSNPLFKQSQRHFERPPDHLWSHVQVGPHMIRLGMTEQELHQFDPSGIGQHLGRQCAAA